MIGLNSEFISSARLDNLYSAFTSIESLIQYQSNKDLVKNSSEIPMLAIYDHEEIGSNTYVGANAMFTGKILKRILD